jgi:hypothetical protein
MNVVVNYDLFEDTRNQFIEKNFSLKRMIGDKLFERDEIKKSGELDLIKYNPTFINKFYKSDQSLDVYQVLSNFPETITNINLSRNYLKFMNTMNLPRNLQKLNISHNQIRDIDQLPENLQELICTENPIKTLPELPQNLTILKCSKCFLQELPVLPNTLQRLSVKKNRLRTLPDSIMNCTSLINLKYENNLDIDIPEEILDFIDQQFERRRVQVNLIQTETNVVNMDFDDIDDDDDDDDIYRDGQNVHDSTINQNVRESINNLIKHMLTEDNIDKILDSFSKIINDHRSKNERFDYLKYLKKLCQSQAVLSIVNLTFCEIFKYVWNRLMKLEAEQQLEVCKIIYNDIPEIKTVCFTGRVCRIVNALNGFCDEVKINISLSQQIQAKYVASKKYLDNIGIYEESAKYKPNMIRKFSELMNEIDVPKDIQKEWLEEI